MTIYLDTDIPLRYHPHMKYKLGTVFKAKMVGHPTFVTATVMGILSEREYNLKIEFTNPSHRGWTRPYNQDVIDKWLADDWWIESLPCEVILDEELFTI